MFYVYRCTTTEKLEHHLNSIVESGDEVFAVQFMGGRDWVIIGRRAEEPTPPRPRQLGEL